MVDIEEVKTQLYSRIDAILNNLFACSSSGVPLDQCRMVAIRKEDRSCRKRPEDDNSAMNMESRYPGGHQGQHSRNGNQDYGSGYGEDGHTSGSGSIGFREGGTGYGNNIHGSEVRHSYPDNGDNECEDFYNSGKCESDGFNGDNFDGSNESGSESGWKGNGEFRSNGSDFGVSDEGGNDSCGEGSEYDYSKFKNFNGGSGLGSDDNSYDGSGGSRSLSNVGGSNHPDNGDNACEDFYNSGEAGSRSTGGNGGSESNDGGFGESSRSGSRGSSKDKGSASNDIGESGGGEGYPDNVDNDCESFYKSGSVCDIGDFDGNGETGSGSNENDGFGLSGDGFSRESISDQEDSDECGPAGGDFAGDGASGGWSGKDRLRGDGYREDDGSGSDRKEGNEHGDDNFGGRTESGGWNGIDRSRSSDDGYREGCGPESGDEGDDEHEAEGSDFGERRESGGSRGSFRTRSRGGDYREGCGPESRGEGDNEHEAEGSDFGEGGEFGGSRGSYRTGSRGGDYREGCGPESRGEGDDERGAEGSDFGEGGESGGSRGSFRTRSRGGDYREGCLPDTNREGNGERGARGSEFGDRRESDRSRGSDGSRSRDDGYRGGDGYDTSREGSGERGARGSEFDDRRESDRSGGSDGSRSHDDGYRGGGVPDTSREGSGERGARGSEFDDRRESDRSGGSDGSRSHDDGYRGGGVPDTSREGSGERGAEGSEFGDRRESDRPRGSDGSRPPDGGYRSGGGPDTSREGSGERGARGSEFDDRRESDRSGGSDGSRSHDDGYRGGGGPDTSREGSGERGARGSEFDDRRESDRSGGSDGSRSHDDGYRGGGVPDTSREGSGERGARGSEFDDRRESDRSGGSDGSRSHDDGYRGGGVPDTSREGSGERGARGSEFDDRRESDRSGGSDGSRSHDDGYRGGGGPDTSREGSGERGARGSEFDDRRESDRSGGSDGSRSHDDGYRGGGVPDTSREGSGERGARGSEFDDRRESDRSGGSDGSRSHDDGYRGGGGPDTSREGSGERGARGSEFDDRRESDRSGGSDGSRSHDDGYRGGGVPDTSREGSGERGARGSEFDDRRESDRSGGSDGSRSHDDGYRGGGVPDTSREGSGERGARGSEFDDRRESDRSGGSDGSRSHDDGYRGGGVPDTSREGSGERGARGSEFDDRRESDRSGGSDGSRSHDDGYRGGGVPDTNREGSGDVSGESGSDWVGDGRSGPTVVGCSDGCPPGMYIARPCTPFSDLVCRGKDIIPELVIPHKRRVWFEDQRKVKDVSFILTAETLRRLPVNRTIVLSRGSGYQVQLEFEMVQLEPILEPVNHSASNDNAHFLASAQEGVSASEDLYSRQWFGGSNVDVSMPHGQGGFNENWHRANETLARLCPYPIPPVYHLTMLVHRNVTTATDPDQSLPGYRPILSRCTTYEQHGNFPPLGSNPLSSEDRRGDFYGDAAAFVSGFSGDTSRGDYRPFRGGFYPTAAADDAYVYAAQRSKSLSAEAPSISCLEPSKLPSVFGPEWNDELAAPQTAFYEEKIQCAQLKEACRACLVSCAEEIKSSSLSCKPTAGPADNGRSGRLETCFDCCAKDNCTYICGKYSAHRCLMRLCSRGTRLDFRLTPEWPKEDPFICHVQPAPSRPIYRLRWSLLHNGHPPTKQTFSASLSLNQPISGPQGEPMWSGGSQPVASSTDNIVKRLPDGTLNQIFRGLLNVDYTLGLSHIPDIISGSANTQAAYYWSTQTIPLVQTTMASNFGAGGSAGVGGGSYASSASNYPFLPPFASPSNDPVNAASTPSLLVWPSKPFEVNTDLWRRLSGAPCASADHLLEKLNIYTPALAPYIGMTDVQVNYRAPYLYSISHTRIKPKLNFSLSKDSSFLGSIFEPASVERGHSLRASLALDLNYGANEDVSTQSQQQNSFWVIDVAGQVSHFPGLFRLKVYPEEAGGSGSNGGGGGVGGVGADNGIEEVEDHEKMPDGDPLLDYEVGVFEENKFELRIVIPAPNEEPDYEKSFRLIILDAKNRLDIRVRRAVQPPAEMQQRRMYTVSSNSALSSLAALVPSLAARQLREASGSSGGNRLLKRGLSYPASTLISSTINRVLPIGPPAEVVYVLILFLLLLFVIHVLGHTTQPDPSHYWIGCTPAQTSDPNATTSAAIFTFRPPDRVTPLTYWRRVFVLVIYLCLKSAYTFSVTLTALIIVTRYFTREPAQQLAGMAEWNGMGRPDHGQSVVSIARQKLLKDAMDAYLMVELRRQQREALDIHKACSAGIDKMFDKMEQAFDVASRRAASRRSRVLVSQAVAEYARVASAASVLAFDSGLATFNITAQWALRRLRGDLEATESLLASSDWLAGARLIYEEVARLRGLAADPGDPTRPFLQWAKLLPPPMIHESAYQGGGPSGFSLPPHLPHFDPDKMRLPTPPVWNEAVESGDGAGDAEAFETRYGPSYIPFVSDAADGDGEQLAWSVYEDNGIKSDQSETDWPKDLLQSASKKKRPSTIQQPDSSSSKSSTESGVVSIFQLNWVHLLCFALFLDGFWLVHRVLHTVDTAERILYGEPIVIDCTDKGLKRRLMKRNRFRKGAKSAFKTFMKPDCVRRICAGALTLLVVCLASAHVKDILSEDVLDYTGYYDNLMLDVHLHARFVNLHIVSSARRLTHQELATTEAHAEHRYQEAQFLLYHWTGWLNRVETEQCRVLLTYKEAARALRSKIAADEGLLGGSLGASHFSPLPLWSSSSSPTTGINASASNEAYVPRHCRLSPAEREAELKLLRKLDPPHCPVHVITPKLFQGYNASEYFAEVVAQSRGWLSAVQEWVSVFLTCLFAFVATICLWNALGASRRCWRKSQTLSTSFQIEESNAPRKVDNHVPPTPIAFQDHNLVTVSDTLNLAPFSKRAVVDFGDSLVVGCPSTRYLRLRNPHPSSIAVHCERYPTGADFTFTWFLTSQDNAENLIDPEHQVLLNRTSPAPDLFSASSLELGPHQEYLLRIVWTPKPAPLPTALNENVPKSSIISNLRHVLQFRIGGSLLMEAVIIASSIRQPSKRKKKLKKAPPCVPVHTITHGVQKNFSEIVSAAKLTTHSDELTTVSLGQRVVLPPLLAPNADLSETLFQPNQHRPKSPSLPPQPQLSVPVPNSSGAPPRRARASWFLRDEDQKRSNRASSSGLRILAAHLASKGKGLSQSLDQLDIEASLLRETGFQTPRRSNSIVNDLHRSSELEPAAAFISPALLSPLLKRNSNVLFSAGSTLFPSVSKLVPDNLFGWDASGGLSEANELGFTRWLNHIFTCGYATRSSISMCTHQEENSRAAVFRLVQTPAFSAPGHRIERELNLRKLLIDKDLNFKADKGLQLRTCELFTSHYSPVWLSLCVDVLTKFVKDPEGRLEFPAKVSSMTKRIHRYLFAYVPPLAAKPKAGNSKSTEKQPGTRQNQVYTEYYNRQVVKRCLMLIWLLDQAKVKKVLRFDPCLFNLSAPNKSSTAVCLALGRNYLTRETNLPRNLSALGVKLTVVQSQLDEFDFTVTNLAVDLRDGLRLVKLADILLVDSPAVFPTHTGSLISLVRFPAISRLQKIHNVRLALSAFERVIGQRQLCTAAGNPISERDIVDGHRAKTLSLLWFILLRFQVTALLNPPALWSEISCLIRTKTTNRALMVALCREADALLSNFSSKFAVETLDPLVEMERNQRALFLWVRAVIAAGGYDHVNVENLDQSFADGRVFCYLLHFYLPTLLPERLVRVVTTQTAGQYPHIPLHMLLRNNAANLRLFQQRLSQLADVPSLLNIGGDPPTVTTVTPAPIHRQSSGAVFLSPGIVLTTLAFLASRIVCTEGGVSRLRRIVRNHAVRIIQAWWRQIRATKGFGFSKVPSVQLIFESPCPFTESYAPATEIQAVESTPGADVVSNNFASTPDDHFTESATPLEAAAGDADTKESIESALNEGDDLESLEINAVSVLASFADRSAFENIKSNEAAICIQRAVRSWLGRRRALQEKNFVVEIQSQARAFLSKMVVQSRQKRSNQRRRLAALIIQNAWRAYLIRRRFVRIRSRVILIQTFWRAVLARRTLARRLLEIRSATVIQRWWRSRRQRRRFIRQRKAAFIIQNWWRDILAVRRRQNLVIQLQAAVRAYLIRRDIVTKTQATIVIQRHVRIWLAYRRELTAACTIQRWWRTTSQRRAFIRSVKSICCIQRWWRVRLFHRRIADAIAKRQEQEAEEMLMKKRDTAAVTIQSAWRYYNIRKQIEEQTRNRERVAAATIQRAWRRYQKRQQREEEARIQVSVENAAALVIQRWWRAYRQGQLAAKRQRAAMIIQRNWRASCLQRWLCRRRRAAIVLQAAWRGHQSRRSFAKKIALQVTTVRKRLSTATKQAREQPHNCLGARARRALANLLNYTSISSVLDALGHLEIATRLSREVCTWLLTVPSSKTPSGQAEYLPHILLRLLHLCNRSVADEQVALAAVAIMLNLVNNVEANNLSDPAAVHNIWWQRGAESSSVETDSTTNRAKSDSDSDSIGSKSIVEYLFLCLHRLSRAKIGTWSVRLFARMAALLSKLCLALPHHFEIPANIIQQIEILLPSVRRLWSSALAKIPVRPEVANLVMKYKGVEGKRKLLLRRVNLELELERLPSRPQIDPLVAYDNCAYKTESTFTEISYKLRRGEEFDEHVSDGRDLKSTITVEGVVMKQIQAGGGKTTYVERIVDGDTIETASRSSSI
ncbi:hypothetical protein Aperf_G00000057287 [Anoplocephala perfoliata]